MPTDLDARFHRHLPVRGINFLEEHLVLELMRGAFRGFVYDVLCGTPSTLEAGYRHFARLEHRFLLLPDPLRGNGMIVESFPEQNLHPILKATLVKLRTRQFAKRQMTWFRRQLQLTWINLEPQSSAEAVAESIAR